MKWESGRESSNVEDYRGRSGRNVALGGGGCGCLTLILVIVGMFLGYDFTPLLQQQSQEQPQVQQQQNNGQQDELKSFASKVLANTEDTWRDIFKKYGGQYREPKMVIFSEPVQSACGYATAATGPFYCPGDEKVYLDFQFFRELQNEFKAPGDFARAYVIAHEIGHHVQNLTGTMDKVNSLQSRLPQAQGNRLSVLLELQADCYAGVWANNVQKKGLLEVGDVEEALRAASGVGDDTIQRRTQGYVQPDSFTHGSSKERMTWFMKGLQTGNTGQCNTFAGVRGF
ncbi:MAG: zinc metallopeptidase [Pyrinomonadaceae bacterium]|jgi:hypothetical protein|nr:zinc metallopeptidase [Pyrinomonadaceae bacterium]